MSNISGAGPSTSAPSSAKCCLACGATAAPGKKLLRCSACLSANYCNAACQKAAWPQHRAECTRHKKLDVYAASPLLAAVAFLPRMQSNPKMLTYEIFKRELHGTELHLHLRNPGRLRMEHELDVSGSRVGPSGEQLHHMILNEGYLEAAVVGSLYGFHCAVQRYNLLGPTPAARAPGASASQPHDKILLVHRTGKITEYGIAIGSTCPDYNMVYHVNGKVHQLQDPRNHVWMYFATEKSDRLYLDVGSLPYGMGMMLNVAGYLPQGTPESQFLRLNPGGSLGAPAVVLDRDDVALVERLPPAAGRRVRETLLADRQRIPVSGLSIDVGPEDAVRRLLEQVRQAVLPRPQSPSPSSDAAATQAVLGAVAAAAVMTAAAASVPRDTSASSSSPPAAAAASGAAAVGMSPGSAGRNGNGGGGGSGGATSASSSQAGRGGGSGGRVRVPFRDGPLSKQLDRAMRHFTAAFNNTAAVLEQRTYQHYPPTLDHARAYAPWVKLSAAPAPPAPARGGAQPPRGSSGSGRRRG